MSSPDNSYTDFLIYLYKYKWKTTPIDDVYDMGTAGATDAQAAVKETPEATTVGATVGTVLTWTGLDTTWINKTGNTQYAMRSKRDVDNTTPTGGENNPVILRRLCYRVLSPGAHRDIRFCHRSRITRLYAQGVLTDTPLNQLS